MRIAVMTILGVLATVPAFAQSSNPNVKPPQFGVLRQPPSSPYRSLFVPPRSGVAPQIAKASRLADLLSPSRQASCGTTMIDGEHVDPRVQRIVPDKASQFTIRIFDPVLCESPR